MNRFEPGKLEQTLRRLPSLPSAVLKLQELTQRSDVDLRVVAKTVSEDIALTTRLLRLANSPFFGLSGQIGSVRQACVVLGLAGVRNLALAASVSGCLQPKPGSGLDRAEFWGHAAKTASAAKSLARLCDADADLAFVAGLLHDVGVLVLDSCMEGDAAKAWLSGGTWLCGDIAAEQSALGIDHCILGEHAAKYWRFPDAVCDAIAGHHGCAPSGDSLYARVVRLADLACREDDADQTSLSPALREFASPLGISEDVLFQWRESLTAMRGAEMLVME